MDTYLRVNPNRVDADGQGEGATPVPIPNTEVKSLSDVAGTAVRREVHDAVSILLLFFHPLLDAIDGMP